MALDNLKAGENMQIFGGTFTTIRADKSAATVISEAHGRYKEAVVAGRCFSLDSDSVTIAAANTTKGALATVKFINGIANPLTSGVNASILKAHVSTVSGTPAGGYFLNYLCGVSNSAAATGTIRARFLTAGNATTQITPLVNVIVAVVGGATTALIQLCTMGGPAAIAAGAGMYDAYEEFSGDVLVPPGSVFGICATGAGTTHIVQSTLVWEELPVANT